MKSTDGIAERLAFMLAVCEAVKECDQAEFICPVCGGHVNVTKSYDKHVCAFCEKCSMKLMQ